MLSPRVPQRQHAVAAIVPDADTLPQRGPNPIAQGKRSDALGRLAVPVPIFIWQEAAKWDCPPPRSRENPMKKTRNWKTRNLLTNSRRFHRILQRDEHEPAELEKQESVDQQNSNDGPAKMENQPPVDQREHAAVALMAARPDLFARQGSVSATWRQRNGKTFGPYYRLSYRENGRQCAIYLGREGPLVDRVYQQLHTLRHPHRQRLTLQRFDRRIRSDLRANNVRLNALLRPLGLWLKGFEVRGWRTTPLRPWLPRRSPCLPAMPRLALPSLPRLHLSAASAWSTALPALGHL